MRTHALCRMLLLLMVVAVVAGCATMPDPPVVKMSPLPDVSLMKKYRSLSLGKLVIKVPRGKKIGGLYMDLNCYEKTKVKWGTSGMVGFDTTEFEDVFREDLTNAGFTVAGSATALFDELKHNEAELIVGALVKEVEYHLCRPIYGWNYESIKGWCHLTVNWQIFSALKQEVVYEVTTEGLYHQDKRSDEVDETDLWVNGFASAVQNLLADKGFMKLVSMDSSELEVGETYDTAIKIDNPKRSIESFTKHSHTAKDAAVLVHMGFGSHGSGFFIDPSGYLLTNRHVTGNAERVTVEMSTGRKLVAEVLRTDVQRDIALLKVEEGVYPALPLADREPNVGEEVFAIGTPLRKDLRFTVTRGIVSAYREYNGLPLIQSDVNIQGGNSGGPLVDAYGNVVGICVIGYNDREGRSFGANGFIPIQSALETLKITLKR